MIRRLFDIGLPLPWHLLNKLQDQKKLVIEHFLSTIQLVMARTIARACAPAPSKQKFVADILMDLETRPRLSSGYGNALLVSGSIYQACKSYELFTKAGLGGKCAIVTSYKPTAASIKGEESGEGLTERLRKYEIYKQMLADWFNEPPDKAVNRGEEFEKAVKKRFVEEPGQMKLPIVVDKLLTGFDAPSATYLYIDREMRDHGLFQAICRVNRLDGDDKDYGYIIDYKDLFDSLKKAVQDYTSGAFDAYDKDDVAGLLEDRLQKGRQDLEEARETVRVLCEPVAAPQDMQAYFRFFCQADTDIPDQLQDKERKRLALCKYTAALIRTYANLANDLEAAGYTAPQIAALKAEVTRYESVRTEVKLKSADYIDLKMYEPAMRYLINQYIRAEDSMVVTNFDDLSLIQLIVRNVAAAADSLPPDIRNNPEAVAETIENNVRKLIIDEQPINPKYYEKMSELLDTLIQQRKQKAIEYADYLKEIAELANKAANPCADVSYPPTLNTQAKRALYDNLDKDEAIALQVHQAIESSRQDDWRYNNLKLKRARSAVKIVTVKHNSRIELHIRPEATPEQRERILREWYRRQLKELIPPVMAKWQTALGVQPAAWSIKQMKTRWGACNIAGRHIRFNLELAKKPALCIDYIVLHELIHLIERHHNDHFVAILNEHIPHWRTLREELNQAPLRHEQWSD